jgi:hypothetical protein
MSGFDPQAYGVAATTSQIREELREAGVEPDTEPSVQDRLGLSEANASGDWNYGQVVAAGLEAVGVPLDGARAVDFLALANKLDDERELAGNA